MKDPARKQSIGLGLSWLGVITTLAGLIVVLGLLIESGPELRQAVETRIWPAREVLGGAVITVGVFVEVALGLFIARSAKRAELKARIAIAEADERAAKAEQAAAEANLARLKIEEHLAWRTITDEQRASLVQQLSRFAGQQISISMWPETDEIATFRYFIAKVLNEAGWKWKLGRLAGPPTLTRGFSISSTSDAATKDAACALLEALSPMGRGGAAFLGILPDAYGPHVELIVQDRGGAFPENVRLSA